MHTPSPPHNALLSLTPLPPPPRSTLFPYTTLFRSLRDDADDLRHNVTLLIIAGVDAEAFADWIFTGKVLLGHSLVDNHNARRVRSEEHTSELQSLRHLVCRLLLEKKKKTKCHYNYY